MGDRVRIEPTEEERGLPEPAEGGREAPKVCSIGEVLDEGCVEVALKYNLFTPEEVLEHLASRPNYKFPLDEELAAYKVVCRKIHPNDQYLRHGCRPHFLLIKRDYYHVARHHQLDLSIKECLFSPHGTLGDNIDCRVLQTTADSANGWRCLAEPKHDYRVHLVSTEQLTTAFRARSFPVFNQDSDENSLNPALVGADWVERFRYDLHLAALVVRRLNYLSKEAPNYFDLAALPAYAPCIARMAEMTLLRTLGLEELTLLSRWYPDVVSPKIPMMCPSARLLSLVDSTVAAYFLGYPIQHSLPTPAQLVESIRQLDQLGPGAYAEKALREHGFFAEKRDDPTWGGGVLLTEATLCATPLEECSPFDLVPLRRGQHVYVFARQDSDHYLADQRNPWTREELPMSVLMEICARRCTAFCLELPPADSLANMLKSINETPPKDSDMAEADSDEWFVVESTRVEISAQQFYTWSY